MDEVPKAPCFMVKVRELVESDEAMGAMTVWGEEDQGEGSQEEEQGGGERGRACGFERLRSSAEHTVSRAPGFGSLVKPRS